jgi:hypothetical protein
MTIELGDLNFIAIIVSVIVVQAVGAAWYSPVLFSKAWMTEVGLTAEQLQVRGARKATPFIVAILGSLIAAWVLAILVQATGANEPLDGVVLGLMTGGGIVATAIGVNYVFELRSLRIFLINAGYPALSLLIMAIILTIWD